MRLVRLVVGRVILGLGHLDCCTEVAEIRQCKRLTETICSGPSVKSAAPDVMQAAQTTCAVITITVDLIEKRARPQLLMSLHVNSAQNLRSPSRMKSIAHTKKARLPIRQHSPHLPPTTITKDATATHFLHDKQSETAARDLPEPWDGIEARERKPLLT